MWSGWCSDSCWNSGGRANQTRGRNAGPTWGCPEAEFVFLGDFTGEEQKSIRRELKVAQVVFAEHFGAVTSDFTVYVEHGRGCC